MFYAENDGGSRISAADYQVGTNKLLCPGCKEAVFFKNGKQKLPHFAHYAHSDCRQFSEGETTLHLLGKQNLFDWLKKQKVQVEMEAWLPKLKQRPDLLVKTNDNRKIAIEYQCSPISTEDLLDRTKGYQENGYEVIWLGGNDYRVQNQLTERHSRFMQYGKTFKLCVTIYDSLKDGFYFYHDFYYNIANQLQYKETFIPLFSITLPIFLAFFHGEGKRQKKNVSHQTYSKAMPQTKRLSLVQRTDETHRLFLENVYLARQSIQSLPAWLFTLPRKTVLYQTPNYIWKFNFLLWVQKKPLHSTIQKEDILQFLRSQLADKNLSIQTTLFVPNDILLSPLYLFLEELEKKGYVKQTRPSFWQICKKNGIFH